MKINENVPIENLVTMRLGGTARYVIEIERAEDIPEAFNLAEEKSLPVFILGGGSNTIGRDHFNGVVLLNKIRGIEITSESKNSTLLRVGSGEILDKVVEFTAKRELTGIEAMTSIPGTIGGAVFQNSGAYGQDLSQVLKAVQVYDSQEKSFKDLNNKEIGFAYRSSIFKRADRNRYFVISADLQLKTGEIKGELYRSLQDYLDENGLVDRKPSTIRGAIAKIRQEKFGACRASAGSFFHNVVIDDKKAAEIRKEYPDAPIYEIGGEQIIASGWLIEQCGFRGKLIHGIRSSQKSALILVNEDAKNYSDLAKARDEIVQAVSKKFGLNMLQEPVEIGE